MRTRLNVDEDLLHQASELTGRTERSALVRLGLEALIAQESGGRMSQLGGSDPDAVAGPRQRGAR